MKRWKAWEKETQTMDYLVANGMVMFSGRVKECLALFFEGCLDYDLIGWNFSTLSSWDSSLHFFSYLCFDFLPNYTYSICYALGP